MACSKHFVVKMSLFHAYKFSHLSWRGAITDTEARAHVHVSFGAPRVHVHGLVLVLWDYRFRDISPGRRLLLNRMLTTQKS